MHTRNILGTVIFALCVIGHSRIAQAQDATEPSTDQVGFVEAEDITPTAPDYYTPFMIRLTDPDESFDDQSMLEAFAEQDGVIKRRSGLLIKILKRGDGPLINPNGTFIARYVGMLPDGTIFDDSYARGDSSQFEVQYMVRGWREALMLMRVGSKWEIALPGDLGYGNDGLEGIIPPNASLYFTLELIALRP